MGEAVEQIRKALGLKTKELALPIIRMIEGKKLRTTGERRGTKYFVRPERAVSLGWPRLRGCAKHRPRAVTVAPFHAASLQIRSRRSGFLALPWSYG